MVPRTDTASADGGDKYAVIMMVPWGDQANVRPVFFSIRVLFVCVLIDGSITIDGLLFLHE
jgi:hypothetical protein